MPTRKDLIMMRKRKSGAQSTAYEVRCVLQSVHLWEDAAINTDKSPVCRDYV